MIIYYRNLAIVNLNLIMRTMKTESRKMQQKLWKKMKIFQIKKIIL